MLVSDETSKMLPDETNETVMFPAATNKTECSNELLHDKTQKLLPEAMNGLIPEATEHASLVVPTRPDETEETSSNLMEKDCAQPEDNGKLPGKNSGSIWLHDATELTLELPIGLPVNDETASAQIEHITDETPEKGPVGKDETTMQPNAVLPDATGTASPDATSSNSALPDATENNEDNAVSAESNDEKPSRGVFKTKTITIRRSKYPCTFKCSMCDTQTPTLHELNAHFIKNHRNVNCDICGKLFQTPASLQKHRYSHIEESEQLQCQTCDKHFRFESQLKSHRHMHQRIRYYKCASANCDCRFRHPGDLAAHARLHGKLFTCAHCAYSNTDIWNLHSHMSVDSRDAPFTCKMCRQKFVHSNQLVRHTPKCTNNKLKPDG